MKLSINSATVQRIPGPAKTRALETALTEIRRSGFESVDIDFCDINSDEFILCGEDWKKKVEHLGQTAQKLDMTLYQCHAPFIRGGTLTSDPRISNAEELAFFEEMVCRTVQAAEMLGIQWVVMHPLTMPHCNYETAATLIENRRYFDKFVELGIRNGVGTAFENMLPSLNRKLPMRYCQHYDELIELVDSYHDPMVGICWDTGHANQAGLEQGSAIRKIGSRLKALHINDNRYGNMDEHLLPYMGSVDWLTVTEALAEVDYRGTLNYETQKVMDGANDEARENLLNMCYANACYLQQLLAQAEQERKACAHG